MSKAEALSNVRIGEFAVPRHVAIIMDGNGRWAAARGLPRSEGHRRGVEALRRTVRAAGDLGIGILTIFSFSSENWSRPAVRNPRPDGAAAPLHPQRPRRAAQERRACARHRRARRSRSRHPRPAGRGRGPDQGQRQAHPRGRLQLRRAAGDRARGAAPGARGRGRPPAGERRHRGQARGRSSTRPTCPTPI